MNPILDTDSYMASHPFQYPPRTNQTFFYYEHRGGQYLETMFFGLQYIIKESLLQPMTIKDVNEAYDLFTKHGEPFPWGGWMHIVRNLGGRIPVRIRAVPEGTTVPNGNVLFTVESTDKRVFWVAGWIETLLVRTWYPSVVATRSANIKKIITNYLEKTADDLTTLPFQLHDFGSRGVSSRETSRLGGMAHLVNFLGTDNIQGVVAAREYYNTHLSGYSVPAAAHCTITAWGKDHEIDAYRNMLDQFAKEGKIVAVVSDSYDYWNALEMWGGPLRDQVEESGATIVVRPDSGYPPDIVYRTLLHLEGYFGFTINSKGYKVLNNVRIIQGDGNTEETIEETLNWLTKAGFSASNVAFGMGGGLLQQVNRDTVQAAYKLSNVVIDGQHKEVRKEPVDAPEKASKAGRLDLVMRGGKLSTEQLRWGMNSFSDSVMRTVYENGELLVDESLMEIRKRSET